MCTGVQYRRCTVRFKQFIVKHSLNPDLYMQHKMADNQLPVFVTLWVWVMCYKTERGTLWTMTRQSIMFLSHLCSFSLFLPPCLLRSALRYSKFMEFIHISSVQKNQPTNQPTNQTNKKNHYNLFYSFIVLILL